MNGLNLLRLKMIILYHLISQYKSIQNPWEVHRKSQTLQIAISIDSNRVFQELEFYQLDHIKRIIEEVIFVWSKNNKEGYQQGMLYILSIIVFIVYQSNNTDFYSDSFMIFDRLMNIELKRYFQTSITYLKRKCDKIINNYLKLIDVDYFLVLERYEINSEIFLL